MKHRIILTVLVLVMIISICTVISAYHYSNSLIEVTVASSVTNTIRVETEIDGAVYYKNVQRLEIPENCAVEELYVEAGDFVAAGDALMRLKEAEVRIAYLEKKLEMEQLELAMIEGGTSGELASLHKELVEEELVELELLIENNGILYASEAGYITEVYENNLEWGLLSGGYTVQWSLPVESYRPYTSLIVRIGKDVYEIEPSEPIYENGFYQYEILLPQCEESVQEDSETAEAVCYQEGMRAVINLQYISEEYTAVLPRNCIRYDADGLAYVYKVASRERNFGEEMYVLKTGVTIIEMDDTRVAVLAEIENVVQRSDGELTDLAAVKIVEE